MTKIARFSNQQLQQRKQARSPKIRTWLRLLKSGPALNVILVVVLVGLGGGYVKLVNTTMASTFHLNDLTHQVAELQAAHDVLQLDTAEAVSLPRLNDLAAAQVERYQPATTVEYLLATHAAVAFSQ